MVQAAHAVFALLGKPKLNTLDTDSAGPLDKLIAALAEKFPVAALGVASIWVGGQILGWFE